MVELKLQHDLKQTLQLMLSPRMLQMLKVLNLSYIGLVEHLTGLSEENPVIEIERYDRYVDFVNYLNSDRKIKKQADFSEMPGLENVGNISKTMEQYLMDQLELEDLDDKTKQMVQMMIENINDLGYLLNYPAVREKIIQKFDVSRPTVDKALKILQDFEPEGVGSRDIKECLLIQINAHNFENEDLENILIKTVKDHLQDLADKNYSKIALALGIDENGVKEIERFIKNNLNPNPGSSFGDKAIHVLPSFAIEPAGKDYKIINLEERYGPIIKLSPAYLKMLENPKTDEKTKIFLREKLQNAKNLLEDFSRRSETLQKIVRRIVDTQADFLAKGRGWLNPLTQKSLSDEFGLAPSTISRSVAEKYIQTSKGIFPLKFLCPRGPKGATAARIKNMIQETIDNEDKASPLSDSKLVEIIKGKGIYIDRRTAAYYRKELNIPSFEERKHGN